MQNILLDVNIILDYYSATRREQFPDSIKVFNYFLTNNENIFLSSSSLDNIAYIKAELLRIEYGYSSKKRKFLSARLVKFLLFKFKLAKTPS